MSHKFPGTGVIGIVDTFCIIKLLLIRLLYIILLCTCQVVETDVYSSGIDIFLFFFFPITGDHYIFSYKTGFPLSRMTTNN